MSVRCTYPGASADVVAQSVAAPIEQQVNGVENMIYMESSSANDGSYSLSVTFRQGVDLNLAQVLVQNRVNLALPMLPDVLKRTGVTTRKMVPRHAHVGEHLFAPRPLRPALSEQLRADAAPRRVAPLPRRERHQRDGAAGLQHEDLGGPRQARRAEPHGRRRGQCHPRAERAGGLGPDRAGAGPPRAGDADHAADARPAGQAGTVRQHHSPHHARRPR